MHAILTSSAAARGEHDGTLAGAHPPTDMSPVSRMSVAASAPVWTSGSTAQLLVDPSVAMPAIMQAIAGARAVVDVTLFSWMATGTGAKLADLLASKAREGVEVNITIDDIGSVQVPGTAGWSQFRRLSAAGVHVRHNESYDLAHRDPVDHRKLYVIDGSVAFVGGMNLSETYDGWHDAMVRLQGPVVAQAGAAFLRRWQQLGGTPGAGSRSILATPISDAGDGAAAIIDNDPKRSMDITELYLDRMQHATGRIWVESPVISSERFAQALCDAARRGVDVRIAVSGSGAEKGIPGLSLISRSFYPQLLAAGVHVLEQQHMSHTKVLIADDMVVLGSLNLTNRSAAHDFELSAAVRDRAFTAEVEGMFASDEGNSRRITASDIGGPLAWTLARLRRAGLEY